MTTGTIEDLYARISKLRKKQLSYLTADQAKEYGFSLEPDWAVKVDWDGEEPKYTYVSPERWEFSDITYGKEGDVLDYLATSPEGKSYSKAELEIPEPVAPEQEKFGLTPYAEKILTEAGYPLPAPYPTAPVVPTIPEDVSGLLQRIYPEKFEPSASYGYSPEEIPAMVAQNIQEWATTDEEAFLTDLMKRGDTADTRALLKMLGGEAITEDVLSGFFAGMPQISQVSQNLMKALPLIVKPKTLDWAVDYFGKNPDALRRNLITVGKNEDTESLVKQLYPEITTQGLKDYFSIDALVIEKKVAEGDGGLIGTFTAGVGDLVANTGGVFKWLGKEGIGEKIIRAGQYMQVQAEPVPFEPQEFTWQQLFNAQFYTTYGVRMLPTLMMLAVPAVGAYGLAGSIAVAAGLGAFSTAVMTGLGGAIMSRPIESAMEAGAAYDEARNQGLSHEEADRVADKVFQGNLWLVGSDFIQLTAAFIPIPGVGTGMGLIARGLVKTTMIGGKLFFTGLTEGGEEIYQEMIQKKALGDERAFTEMIQDPEMGLVFSLGAIAGLGMGAGGDIIVRIQNRVVQSFNTEQKTQFDKDKTDFVSQGFPEDVATQKALDNAVEGNPELEKVVEDATKAVEKEITFEQIKPEDEASRVAFEHLKEQAVGEVTPEVVTPVTPEVVPKVVVPKAKPPAIREVKPEIKPPVAPTPIVNEMKALHQSITTEVSEMQTAVKGLRGDEAKIARESLAGLDRELRYVNRILENFQKRPDMPEATKLRQTIMAWSRMKGIPKSQLQRIMSEVAGRRQLRVIPQEQLMSILDKVKEARPVRIKGERVVTPKTEKKIQTLKENLISSRQMTNKIYDRLMERLNLTTDKYETAYKYISESDAKSLIRAMNDEVVLAKWDIQVEDSLNKNPKIKEVRDVLNDRGMKGTGVEFDGKPIEIKRRVELWSMRYYMLNLQKKLSAPIYDAWQKINQAHLVARDRHNQQLARLERSTPNFKEIATDDEALIRIENYIASKHNLAKIKAPELSVDEMAVATELERGYFEAENDVRFIRFTNAYAENEGDIDLISKEIPNAPKRALRRAIDIYEGKGADALRTFTDTQKWGVIKSGYDPRSFIKPILYYREPASTTFARGLLRTRNGVEYQANEKNIIQRYSTHQKQLIALQEMSGLIRAFGRLYSENAVKLAPSTRRGVSSVLSRGFNEMKGYREEGGAIVHMIERLYGQVASAVFWRPDLVARNKFQNFAFNPDYWAGRFFDPRNKPLTESRRRWFEVFVSQERVFQMDYLMYGEKPLPGFGRITRLARRTSLYPWSDKSNRAEAYMVRINRVDRALELYEKDGDIKKLIQRSGMNEFEPRQQAEALELLAMDKVDYGIDGMPVVSGKEAFALYNSQQLVNNVHFLYDRSQRAPAEMGATGKTLGNILVFSRSWGERFILQGRKLDPKTKIPMVERTKAMQVIVGIIVAGLLAGETYKKLTGKQRNPYNPLNILTWSPGGLAVGVTEDISNVIYLITQAAQGDKSALGSLPNVIAGVATLTLPFYKNLIQALDAVTGMKNIDVYAMRKIRELIDDEYEVRGGTHEVDRTLLEALQKALFAKYDEPDTLTEKITAAEELLGTTIEEEDKPFNLEEPDIYSMSNLGGRFSQILGGFDPEGITKGKGYSEKAVAWAEKERYKDIYDSLPNKNLYEITELTEEQAGWAKKHKRLLILIEEYQGLEGKEQDDFLEKHPELKVNPAVEYLKQFPTDNAQLAVWGQAKLYTMEAYNEFNKLVKELDIPDDAIPELTLPPKGSVENYFKYQDVGGELGYNSWEVQLLMAQDNDLREWLGREPIETLPESLELKIKHREDYDAYDLLTTDEERKQYKLDHPEWVDGTRRIEAIENNGIDFQDLWVERGNTIDEFSAGSSEAKVWLVDHKDIWDWALENELLTDDGKDWNVPVLRINKDYRQQDNEYQDILDKYGADQSREQREATEAYLKENPEYAEARIKRDGYSLGLDEPTINNWVEYNQLPSYGAWRDRYRKENPDFDTAVKEAQANKGQKPWMDIIPDDVPLAPYDELYEKYKDLFGQYEDVTGTSTERAKARQKIFTQNPAFKEAYYRRKAYGELWDEKYVNNYATYMLLPDKGYAKERLLKSHQDFYLYARKKLEWKEDIDFDLIPSEKVEKLYDQYQDLPSGLRREEFRFAHQDLDAWLVKTGKVSKSITETYRIRKLTPKEKFAEVATEADIEFDIMLEELRARLEALK